MQLDEHLLCSELFQVYGGMLKGSQYEIFNMYLNQNLGMTEIAQIMRITRQAVYNSLTNAKQKLKDAESLLKFVEKKNTCKNLVSEIQVLVNTLKIGGSGVELENSQSQNFETVLESLQSKVNDLKEEL